MITFFWYYIYNIQYSSIMFHSSSVLIKHLTSIIKHLHIIPIFRRSKRKPNFRKRNIWLFWFMFIKKNMWQWLPMSNHLVCVCVGGWWGVGGGVGGGGWGVGWVGGGGVGGGVTNDRGVGWCFKCDWICKGQHSVGKILYMTLEFNKRNPYIYIYKICQYLAYENVLEMGMYTGFNCNLIWNICNL